MFGGPVSMTVTPNEPQVDSPDVQSCLSVTSGSNSAGLQYTFAHAPVAHVHT